MEERKGERRERELESGCGLRRGRESLRSVLEGKKRREKGWKKNEKSLKKGRMRHCRRWEKGKKGRRRKDGGAANAG